MSLICLSAGWFFWIWTQSHLWARVILILCNTGFDYRTWYRIHHLFQHQFHQISLLQGSTCVKHSLLHLQQGRVDCRPHKIPFRVVHLLNSMRLLSKTFLLLFQETLERQRGTIDHSALQHLETLTRKLPICLKAASSISLYLSESMPYPSESMQNVFQICLSMACFSIPKSQFNLWFCRLEDWYRYT